MKKEKRIKKPSKLFSILIYILSSYYFIVAIVYLIDFFIPIKESNSLVRYFMILNTPFFVLPFTVILSFGMSFYKLTIKANGNKYLGIIPLVLILVIIFVQACYWYMFGLLIFYLGIYGIVFVVTLLIRYFIQEILNGRTYELPRGDEERKEHKKTE